MTTPTTRSVPKVAFTDAEAGAKEFPDSNSRRYNYYTPARRNFRRTSALPPISHTTFESTRPFTLALATGSLGSACSFPLF